MACPELAPSTQRTVPGSHIQSSARRAPRNTAAAASSAGGKTWRAMEVGDSNAFAIIGRDRTPTLRLRLLSLLVIPAKAGIQVSPSRRITNLGPGLRRSDD